MDMRRIPGRDKDVMSFMKIYTICISLISAILSIYNCPGPLEADINVTCLAILFHRYD